MSVLVRPAVEADAGAIASIHVRGWQAAYKGIVPAAYLAGLSIEERTRTWAAGISAGAMPDGGNIYVAESDGAVLGWLTCGPSRDEGAPAGVGELHGIYVDPEIWGAGAGSALMDFCVGELRVRGYTHATLWVLADNVAARAWYERRGWAFDGTHTTFTVAGQELDECRHARSLSSLGRVES